MAKRRNYPALAHPAFARYFAGQVLSGFGVLFIVFQSTLQSTLQTRSEPAFLGRVMSLYTLGIFGTTPIGAPITGWLIDHVSPRAAMGMGAVATGGCALWLGFARPDARIGG